MRSFFAVIQAMILLTLSLSTTKACSSERGHTQTRQSTAFGHRTTINSFRPHNNFVNMSREAQIDYFQNKKHFFNDNPDDFDTRIDKMLTLLNEPSTVHPNHYYSRRYSEIHPLTLFFEGIGLGLSIGILACCLMNKLTPNKPRKKSFFERLLPFCSRA